MNNYGVVLRKLREINQLPLKQAAKHIGKSAGWLSEIENGKGFARIHPQEFERIVAAYSGEAYRKQFGIWIAKAHVPIKSKEIKLDGAILKHLREKAEYTLEEVATETDLSKCYLSYIENGLKPLPAKLKDRLMRLYGYSPSSFKNFATEDKRAKNIPTRYKLTALIKQLDESAIEKVFSFALENSGTKN